MVQDDILPKLMTSTGSQEDLFRKELSKYDSICQEIAENLDSQEHLLAEIQVCSVDSGCISSSQSPTCNFCIHIVHVHELLLHKFLIEKLGTTLV